jgi:hypothetical protein
MTERQGTKEWAQEFLLQPTYNWSAVVKNVRNFLRYINGRLIYVTARTAINLIRKTNV